MKEVQVEVIKANGELKFQFIGKDLQNRPLQIDNVSGFELSVGDKFWATIVDSTAHKKDKTGPVIVQLIRKIDVPQFTIVKSLEDFWIDPVMLTHIQILLLDRTTDRCDIVLLGHKGTGKTDFAYRLAKAWNCQICKVDCGTLQTGSALFGFEAAEKGATVWRPSAFWKFCQQAIAHPSEKFLLVLDELNRMHSKMAESLHGLFDHTRQVSFTTSEGTKVLKMPTNVMTIATRNSGQQYTGVYEMDNALKDRFVPFWFTYLPEQFEIDMLCQKHGIHEFQAGPIVRIANSMREAEINANLSYSPSPRLTNAAAILVKHNQGVFSSVKSVFLGNFDPKSVEYKEALSHIRKFLKEDKAGEKK